MTRSESDERNERSGVMQELGLVVALDPISSEGLALLREGDLEVIDASGATTSGIAVSPSHCSGTYTEKPPRASRSFEAWRTPTRSSSSRKSTCSCTTG